uniref:Uncharacterized protein n=1 Tax=Rhizophora mucronata TaxID=61149 RepID=A0A2P2QF96_RHIMU
MNRPRFLENITTSFWLIVLSSYTTLMYMDRNCTSTTKMMQCDFSQQN